MSIRRMMLFTLGGFFKSIISIFKTRVLNDGGNFEAETNLENQLNTLGSTLFDSASLVITPNGVKTSKLYSIKPNDGTGDLSVIRATTATRVNEQGLIEPVPYNLFSYSEDFGNSFWTKNNSTVTTNTNQTMSPIGTNTVDLYVPNTTLGEHQINPLFPYSDSSLYINSSNTYNWSIYVKSAGNNFFLLRVNINGTWSSVVFNLSSSSIVSAHPNFISAKIESVNDGWQLLSCVFTGVNGVNVFQHISSPTGDIAFSGNDTSGAYIWGAQLTIGTSKREYFATTDKLNVARIDYTTGSPAILVEPQRTNLFLRSEEFDNSWTKVSSSVTPDTTLAPTGLVKADTITSTGTLQVFVLQLKTITSGAVYSISFYIKQNTQRFIYIRFTSNSLVENYVSAVFDLQDGTTGQTSVGTTSGTLISSDVRDAGNGFYRVSITASINATDGNIGIGFAPAKTGNTFSTFGAITSTVINGNSIFLWGAQLEVGSNVTSYIPTTTSSVTRNADVISKSGISNLIGQTEGTIFFEYFHKTAINAGFRNVFSLEGNVSNQFNNINFSTSLNENNLFVTVNVLGVTAISGNPIGTEIRQGWNKVAFGYNTATNGTALYLNGNLIATRTLTGIPSMSRIAVMARINSYTGFDTDRQYGSQMRIAALFPTRLSNTELAQLTTL